MPCPHCNHMQPLEWKNLTWDKGDPDSVLYTCEECACAIEEYHKEFMLSRGEWRATSESLNKLVRGYHLSSLYSPLGWFSWSDAVRMWEEAQGKPDKLRVFVNTVLGETWAEKGEAPDW